MATPPNRNAGVNITGKSTPVIKYSQLNDINGGGENSKKHFRITTIGKAPYTWNFALLPSVEAALQYGPNTSVKGTITVPEVKPGILNSTAIKYKNSLVPGGAPVIQGVGIQATTRQLVGLFIGSEGLGENKYPSLNPIYRLDNNQSDYKETGLGYSQTNNAVSKAIEFDTVIVQGMKPVKVEIKSDITFTFECVIVNFKYYVRSANRVYYVMDVLSTKYRNE